MRNLGHPGIKRSLPPAAGTDALVVGRAKRRWLASMVETFLRRQYHEP